MSGGRASAAPLGDVLVVGGGIIGLASARALAREGFRPVVVDPGAVERRATWAAGGMLAPLGEAPKPGPFLDLATASLSLYPEFVAGVEAESGLAVECHLNGKILTADTDQAVEDLQERRSWLEADGHTVRWLDGNEVRDLEPNLSRQVVAGLLLEGNGRVNNRALLDALARAVAAAGVERVTGEVVRVLAGGGKVTGVELAGGGTLEASAVLLSAGAWSGAVGGLPRPLPVRPVKGQMLAFSTPTRPLARVTTSSGAYLIPREGARGPLLVVGATSEDAGFDLTVGGRGQNELAAAARALCPALARATVVERWSGLRPGTPDEHPVLGPDPELEGLWYATGHYRNGVLLAPATAALVAGGLARGEFPPSAFRPDRFGDPTLVADPASG